MAQPDPAVLARLQKASARLMMAVSNLLRLTEVFDELNSPGERRETLAKSPGGAAIFLYENAILREQILILARVFDRPGTDRLSFPVVRKLLAQPGVAEHYVADAHRWPLLDPDESEAIVRTKIENLSARLDRLEQETPNRLKLIRNFRDENIAHELWFEIPRERPIFHHLWSMVPEAKACAEEVKLVIEGASIGWSSDTAGRSAKWLWDSVAVAAERPRRG